MVIRKVRGVYNHNISKYKCLTSAYEAHTSLSISVDIVLHHGKEIEAKIIVYVDSGTCV